MQVNPSNPYTPANQFEQMISDIVAQYWPNLRGLMTGAQRAWYVQILMQVIHENPDIPASNILPLTEDYLKVWTQYTLSYRAYQHTSRSGRIQTRNPNRLATGLLLQLEDIMESAFDDRLFNYHPAAPTEIPPAV